MYLAVQRLFLLQEQLRNGAEDAHGQAVSDEDERDQEMAAEDQR